MDTSITQMEQDLARAAYATATRSMYVRTVEHLGERFRRPVTDLTREDIRTYVDEISALGKSPVWLSNQMSALKFLYRKTLARPEMVSFLKSPRRHKTLPTVLSLEQVSALLGAIRVLRYQALVMVLYGAGLRISEALALEVTDIDGARTYPAQKPPTRDSERTRRGHGPPDRQGERTTCAQEPPHGDPERTRPDGF